MTPVFGSSLVILFATPKLGIQRCPSLLGAALNGMRLGPGISYSTYTMFIASLVNLRVVFLYSGRSAGDRGTVASVPNELFKNYATSPAFLSSNPQDQLKCIAPPLYWTPASLPSP